MTIEIQVYLPMGHQAEIHCHFDANPKIKEVKWSKDGAALNVAADERLHINPKDGQSLIVKQVSHRALVHA